MKVAARILEKWNYLNRNTALHGSREDWTEGRTKFEDLDKHVGKQRLDSKIGLLAGLREGFKRLLWTQP